MCEDDITFPCSSAVEPVMGPIPTKASRGCMAGRSANDIIMTDQAMQVKQQAMPLN